MRTLAALLVLAACDPADLAPIDPPADGDRDPVDPAAPTHTLVLPAAHVTEAALAVHADLVDGEARAAAELDLGLADELPDRLTLAAGDGLVLADGCKLRPGAVRWTTLVDVTGDAADVALVDGAVRLALRAAGTTRVTLAGELADQACDDLPATVSLRHELVVQVRPVAGYVVETFHQHRCPDAVVLPADAPLSAPTARPVDPHGAAFSATNAPAPVTLTLESPAALTAAGGGYFTADPGDVVVHADTDLPVDGLLGFTVIGPTELTDVTAALYLQRAAAKGTVSEPLLDGAAYPLFFPEQRNTIDVHVDAATSQHGPVCANLPPSWFTATSTTPDRCGALAEPDADTSPWVAVARILQPGECRLDVNIRGTDHAWSTAFRTTAQP